MQNIRNKRVILLNLKQIEIKIKKLFGKGYKQKFFYSISHNLEITINFLIVATLRFLVNIINFIEKFISQKLSCIIRIV